MRLIGGAQLRPCAQLLFAGILGLTSLNAALAQFTPFPTTRFAVKENGDDPLAPIVLDIPFLGSIAIKSLTSPSGDVMTASLSKEFPTLEAAFSYLAGTWHGTYSPLIPFGGPAQEFEFQVGLVSPTAVYRQLPRNVSLQDGDRIPNGQTFVWSWDYDSDTPVHGTSLQVFAQVGSFTFNSLTILPKPQPSDPTSAGGTSSSGTGNQSGTFMRRYESEPGATEYRYLTTYEASGTGSPLPADIMVTMGAVTSLNSSITNDENSGGLSGAPIIGLQYYFTADPIEFQLVAVPEPASWALISSFAMAGIRALRRRLVVS